MFNRKISMGMACLALLALLVSGCGGDKTSPNSGATSAGGGGKPPATAYNSPQEVFDAAKEAMKKEDMGQFVSLLTEDSQKAIAGMMVSLGGMMKMLGAFVPPGSPKDTAAKVKEMVKPIDDAFAKHGMTEEKVKAAMAKAQKWGPEGPPEGKVREALASLGEGINDPGGLMQDIIKGLSAMNPEGGDQKMEILKQNAELIDLKVEGDTATGKVKTEDGKQEPIAFKKTDKGWRIDIPEEMFKTMMSQKGGGPGEEIPPPPGPGGLPKP